MSSAHQEGAAYRRAADYVAESVIFLRGNVLLREPLRPEHIKPRLLGHWGSCPGITMVYAALVRERDADGLLVPGPGRSSTLSMIIVVRYCAVPPRCGCSWVWTLRWPSRSGLPVRARASPQWTGSGSLSTTAPSVARFGW